MGYLTLPAELHAHIISYITSYADLKALCLTNPVLRPYATQALYETMVLGLEQLNEECVCNLFNSGLENTRSLKVVDKNGSFDHRGS
jgi:hypothetical protein